MATLNIPHLAYTFWQGGGQHNKDHKSIGREAMRAREEAEEGSEVEGVEKYVDERVVVCTQVQ